MRQVASHVKDGRLQYFVADTDEGELHEFATINVPDTWTAQQSIVLGFNLIAAIGLTSAPRPTAPARTAPIDTDTGALPVAAPSRTWRAGQSVVEYVRAHPGCRVYDIVRHYRSTPKAVASAVTREASAGTITRQNGALFPTGRSIGELIEAAAGAKPTKPKPERRKRAAVRKQWDVTGEQVAEYIAQHPGCGTPELATALLGEATKETRQVIANRVQWMTTRGVEGYGRLDKVYATNPSGGPDLVQYRFVPSTTLGATEEEPDAPTGVREPNLD